MTTTERPLLITRADWVRGPEQGNWTYQHYTALPDDGQRYEIMDGVLYYMTPAPSIWHQKVALHIARHLSAIIEDTGLGQVFIAPVDVELDYKTVVQPDVLVIMKDGPAQITPSHIIGAPNLVIEISSPSTAGYDRRIKQDTYARAGVFEYWIVDPLAHTVELLRLKEAAYQPIGLFSGEQTIPSDVTPSIKTVQVGKFFA